MSSILIVDDSKLNLAFMENTLKSAGYEDVWTANSAQEAYERLGIQGDQAPRKPVAVDLVLLDIVMPEVDGIEACRRIKNVPAYQDLPIIFLTADRAHFKEAFNVGGMDFIEKGGPDYELLARVQSALRLKKEMDARKDWESRVSKDLQLARHLQNSVMTPPLTESGISIRSSFMQSSDVSRGYVLLEAIQRSSIWYPADRRIAQWNSSSPDQHVYSFIAGWHCRHLSQTERSMCRS